MIRWLLKFFVPSKKKLRQKQQIIEKSYSSQSQIVAIPYSLAALLFFGMQGLVATMGAVDLVFPDLPSPIRYETGRAIHLNLSVYWPLLGSMGIVYYFFIQEAETELYSTRLAWVQLILYLITGFTTYLFFLLGFLRGTEYHETTLALDLGLLLTLTIFAYNLTRTYLKPKVPRNRVTLITMLLGSLSLLVLYIPNILKYVHPTTNEIVRFWIVHLWEEMSKELLVLGVLVAFFLAISDTKRKSLERPLFFQTGLLIISATLATGHHYYWVGTPFIWLWIGGIFSIFQTVAIFLLGYIAYLALQGIDWKSLGSGTKLALTFTLCSIFYHLIGAALMGLTIAIPQFNRYCHGTFITSAHAHLAVFGALGLLVLAGCTYILNKDATFTKLEANFGWLGLIIINAGLLTMSGTLSVAGLLQTYLWRVIGMDFMDTYTLLRPYLILRAAGGAMFAGGDLLFVWVNISLLWQQRQSLFKKFLGVNKV